MTKWAAMMRRRNYASGLSTAWTCAQSPTAAFLPLHAFRISVCGRAVSPMPCRFLTRRCRAGVRFSAKTITGSRNVDVYRTPCAQGSVWTQPAQRPPQRLSDPKSCGGRMPERFRRCPPDFPVRTPLSGNPGHCPGICHSGTRCHVCRTGEGGRFSLSPQCLVRRIERRFRQHSCRVASADYFDIETVAGFGISRLHIGEAEALADGVPVAA